MKLNAFVPLMNIGLQQILALCPAYEKLEGRWKKFLFNKYFSIMEIGGQPTANN